MKMSKKKFKITIIILLTILITMLICSCLYVNRENFIKNIDRKSQTLQTQEGTSHIEGRTNQDTSKWDLEKVNIIYDKDNVPVPVPKGYVASKVENGVTPIGEVIEEENRVDTGFVIYEMTAEEIENGTEVNITKDNFWEESQKRNQWVWVPVPDSSRIYERDSSTGKAKSKLYQYSTTGRTQQSSRTFMEPDVATSVTDNEKKFAINNMQGMTKIKLLEELENEYEATIESIEKYGGFYIGRYETGNIGLENSNNTQRRPVTQRMNTNISNITWYDAYNNTKNIQKNEKIKSNVIWGSLWYETLQWLVDSGSKSYGEIENSLDWGNYADSSFDYTSIKETLEHKNLGFSIPTGSSERNKANNIYDMAGNMCEWTLESAPPANRTHFGGNYAQKASYSWETSLINSNPDKKTH